VLPPHGNSHHFESFTATTMTWLTVTEYLCHKWPLICSVCRNYNPVHSWLITGLVTSITRRVPLVENLCSPSSFVEFLLFNLWFSVWCCVDHYLSFCPYVFLAIVLSVLRFVVSDPFGNFKVFIVKNDNIPWSTDNEQSIHTIPIHFYIFHIKLHLFGFCLFFSSKYHLEVNSCSILIFFFINKSKFKYSFSL